MFRPFRLARTPIEDHEAVFLERYGRLHARATRLAGDRQQADDLVQDAFVHFVLARTPLEDIRNLDAYLFTMLQYLHASEMRRVARRRPEALELVDHDTADIALRSSDAAARYQAAEQLRLICEYACRRRETSKAGAALLLRYFHGYYVREIAQVFRSAPASVDGLLHQARREAKAHLEDPPGSTPPGPVPAAPTVRHGALTRRGCLDDLRAGIFAWAHGSCFEHGWFEDVYGSAGRQPSCAELAEIVTCPRCLDAASAALGLPLLADRYPTDSLGPDRRSGDLKGPPDAGGTGDEVEEAPKPEAEGRRAVLRLRRAVEDVREHRPQELFVAVNGFMLASQRTGAAVNEQRLTVTTGEPIGFVEIFSDQQVRMLFLEVRPAPEGPIEQRRRVELAGGRTLEAVLSFEERWPTLHISYRDPQADVVPATASAGCETAWTADRPAGKRRGRYPSGGPGWGRALGLWLRRPVAVPAAVVMLLLGWWAYHGLRGTPGVSARELLRQAVVTEQGNVARAGEARHRILHLEERRPQDGTVLGRTRIEVWTGGARGETARRAFDERTGRLEALELSSTGAPSTIYRRAASPDHRAVEARALAGVLDAAEPWRLDLSAAQFADLFGNAAAATVEQTSAGFVVHTRSGPTGDSGTAVLEASLTLTADPVRLVAAVLLVRQPAGTREYRLTERFDERVPAAAAGADTFEPDAGLVVADLGALTAPAVPGRAALSPQESNRLQVHALFLLNQAGATLGEQVSVRGGPEAVLVEALVDGQARRQELLRALAPLEGQPGVRIVVRTLSEPGPRGGAGRLPTLVRGVEATRDRVAAHDEVRRYLGERAGAEARGAEADAQVERKVAQFGAAALEHARKAVQRAWALDRLVKQVAPTAVASLDAESRARWHSMLREHALTCRNETAALSSALVPVFRRGTATPATDRAVGTAAPGDIEAVVGNLLALAMRQDEAIRAAFALSTADSVPALPLTQTEFWDVMHRIETLAARLGEEK